MIKTESHISLEEILEREIAGWEDHNYTNIYRLYEHLKGIAQEHSSDPIEYRDMIKTICNRLDI